MERTSSGRQYTTTVGGGKRLCHVASSIWSIEVWGSRYGNTCGLGNVSAMRSAFRHLFFVLGAWRIPGTKQNALISFEPSPFVGSAGCAFRGRVAYHCLLLGLSPCCRTRRECLPSVTQRWMLSSSEKELAETEHLRKFANFITTSRVVKCCQ